MGYLYNKKDSKLRRKFLRNNMPNPEKLLWYHLMSKNLKGYKFRRQYGVGNYILDFYCPGSRLGIEIDGDSHFLNSKVKFYDKDRDQFLKSQNIKVIRFTNSEVNENINSVLGEIMKHLS
ncbi:MAG: endonuclease domain-containing protein [bacterium]|nr:endonuclease domain-containing protein [bacterium]